jgi:hypothetical protein
MRPQSDISRNPPALLARLRARRGYTARARRGHTSPRASKSRSWWATVNPCRRAHAAIRQSTADRMVTPARRAARYNWIASWKTSSRRGDSTIGNASIASRAMRMPVHRESPGAPPARPGGRSRSLRCPPRTPGQDARLAEHFHPHRGVNENHAPVAASAEPADRLSSRRGSPPRAQTPPTRESGGLARAARIHSAPGRPRPNRSAPR